MPPHARTPEPPQPRGHQPTTLSRINDFAWLGKRWETDDDLGVRVRLFSPDTLASPHDIAGGAMNAAQYAELRRQIIAQLPAASRQLRTISWILIVVMALMTVAEIASYFTGQPVTIRRVVFDLLLIRFGSLALFIILLRGLGDSPPTLRAVFLRNRRCPSCGFDLSATPADHTGITTCTECRAAWRLTPPAR